VTIRDFLEIYQRHWNILKVLLSPLPISNKNKNFKKHVFPAKNIFPKLIVQNIKISKKKKI